MILYDLENLHKQSMFKGKKCLTTKESKNPNRNGHVSKKIDNFNTQNSFLVTPEAVSLFPNSLIFRGVFTCKGGVKPI